jgi:hypothetical protein
MGILIVKDNPTLDNSKLMKNGLHLLGTKEKFKMFIRKYSKEYATKERAPHWNLQ